MRYRSGVTKHTLPRSSRGRTPKLATVLGAVAVAASCLPTVEPLATNDARCPNVMPVLGGACEPGLSCKYSEPTNCAPYFTANCAEDGRWMFDRSCAGTSASSTSGGGNEGGGGTGGGCDDPIEGPPTLLAPTKLVLPPDATSGGVVLTFSEPLAGSLTTKLAWVGPGQIVGVAKLTSTTYEVRYAGLAPGELATLEIAGVKDACGETMTTPGAVDVELLPSCHLFFEDFEADFLASGWQATDGAASGNLWGSSDDLGAENHTLADGACATANDLGSAPSSGWNASLRAPIVDLTKVTTAVVHYEGAFSDPSGDGLARLEASEDGATWTPLTAFANARGPRREHVDLGAFVGRKVHLRWRYQNGASGGAYWDVDDVCVETYTKPSCPCPAGGREETLDIAGSVDGNGTLDDAEPTQKVVGIVGEKLVVCGTLDAESGPDVHAFGVDTSKATGLLEAKVETCVENAYDGVNAGLLDAGNVEPVAGVENAVGQSTFKVSFEDSGGRFLAIAPKASPFSGSRYTMTLTVTSTSAPLFSESFESWPASSLTEGNLDACLGWKTSTATTPPLQPVPPPDGDFLAYFNSYDCDSGSESLETGLLNFKGKSTVTLTFAMYHDLEYPESVDTLQVEYLDGDDGWVPIGPTFERPAAVAGWKTEVVDLSAIAGKNGIRLRLLATSAFGTNVHVDDVVILAN